MSSSPAHLRSLYRSLLRELPPRPILSSPRSHIHSRIRQTFSSSSAEPSLTSPAPSSSSSSSSPELASQLVSYLRSQRMYATLLERYNPGMDMDEEERVRLTARRVGMDLPVTHKK